MGKHYDDDPSDTGATDPWRCAFQDASAAAGRGLAGDDAALRDAVHLYREAVVPLAPRGTRPQEWAKTQDALGTALQALGMREEGTAALEEAAAAFEAALEIDPVDAPAPVTIACEWRGTLPPLDAPLCIVSRAGVDLAPIDAADPAERERVLSYIWPDQPERLARTAAALDIAAQRRAQISQGDAAAWVEQRLAETPEPGVTRVVMHTITWQYLPPQSQARIEAALKKAGAEATAESPLAWLRLEPDGIAGSAAISLTLWPTGETTSLGRGDYHGRFADWT